MNVSAKFGYEIFLADRTLSIYCGIVIWSARAATPKRRKCLRVDLAQCLASGVSHILGLVVLQDLYERGHGRHGLRAKAAERLSSGTGHVILQSLDKRQDDCRHHGTYLTKSRCGLPARVPVVILQSLDEGGHGRLGADPTERLRGVRGHSITLVTQGLDEGEHGRFRLGADAAECFGGITAYSVLIIFEGFDEIWHSGLHRRADEAERPGSPVSGIEILAIEGEDQRE